MFCSHIWIPNEILSILVIHTWGRKVHLPPIVCEKEIRRLWRQNWDNMWSAPSKHFGHFEGVSVKGCTWAPPSRGCKSGQNGYTTPAVLGVPNAHCGDEIRSGYSSPVVLGTHMQAKWLQPLLTWGPQCGDKIRIGCSSPAVSGAYVWANGLHNPCCLGGPHRARGEKSESR